MTSMPYHVAHHRIYSRNSSFMHFTRTLYYVLHGKPSQLYPLYSGRALTTFEAARMRAQQLSKQGYYGWILRVQEMRQEDWPEDHWRIDHSSDEAIAWLAQF
jgi:hypothetical protein